MDSMGFGTSTLDMSSMPTMPPMSGMGNHDSVSNATGVSNMPGMEGMDMTCKISMLWNWWTIDTCFLSSSWHIRSRVMFAGSCVGVICLVLCLELLRRVGREYDAFILRRAQLRKTYLSVSSSDSVSKQPNVIGCDCPCAPSSAVNESDVIMAAADKDVSNGKMNKSKIAATENNASRLKEPHADGSYRPSPPEQVVRAFLHTLQFAVAYIIMLLAMYYNGYIIISIFIGAFLGSLIFSWEPVSLNKE
ncbi:hypothetical protein N7462_002571 [Penicillium macrosclerotiorum]|uniref:uncharacterized protein n=1 Tax=Penicillium macrosclerotiorum TaxID=303699 RepID=UPI00254890F4|nr:uncharacterized protein N7462_002571 [Penicillium macrosclerotiorum]KAJ5693148.1 hypothetical protein N7462_002571 [Penicillium macrosclerotiorum]